LTILQYKQTLMTVFIDKISYTSLFYHIVLIIIFVPYDLWFQFFKSVKKNKKEWLYSELGNHFLIRYIFGFFAVHVSVLLYLWWCHFRFLSTSICRWQWKNVGLQCNCISEMSIYGLILVIIFMLIGSTYGISMSNLSLFTPVALTPW